MAGRSFDFVRAFIAVSGCACLCACSTYRDDTRAAMSDWMRGNYSAAAGRFSDGAGESSGSADELVWKLEQASALRASGDLTGSAAAFEEAFKLVAKFDAEPEIDLAGETKAAFTNLSYLPYVGYNYDRIMLGVYQALNFMELGKFDEAAVMFKRVENFQNAAERENASKVNKSISEASKISGQKRSDGTVYNYNAAMGDAKFRSSLMAQYGIGAFGRAGGGISARGLYVNPFAYWLDGVYFTVCGLDSADRARAVDSLRLARDMVAASCIDSDLEIARRVSDGEAFPDRTYVIFETGAAPSRKQIRIDIPLFIATRDVPYVGAAFPKLERNADWSPSLIINAGGKAFETEMLADMDAIVEREFQDLLPMVIAKTLISAGTKAAMQYGFQEAVRQSDNQYALLAAMIVGSIYQASMNDADLRSWRTLPKQIRAASFPTPKDLKLLVGTKEIKLADAKANFVLVRRTGANSKISVSTFAVGKR